MASQTPDVGLIRTGADGIDVVQTVTTIGGPPRGPWDFHVTFAEIDELRILVKV